jgi:hypothetical protein
VNVQLGRIGASAGVEEVPFAALRDGERFMWPETGGFYTVAKESIWRRAGRALRIVRAEEYNATDGELSVWFAPGALVIRLAQIEVGHA